MSEGSAEAELRAHVRRFNEGVRTSDFTEMVDQLAADVEMAFLGVDAGPFAGRDAVAAAYREQPPSDEIVLVTVTADDDAATAAADYAWRADPGRVAGRIAVRLHGGRICRLDISFVDGEMGDA